MNTAIRSSWFLLTPAYRKIVAETVGANLDEIVLVPNATHGLNTILRNFEWREGDIIIGGAFSAGDTPRCLSD